jgi:hypothetical protein
MTSTGQITWKTEGERKMQADKKDRRFPERCRLVISFYASDHYTCISTDENPDTL